MNIPAALSRIALVATLALAALAVGCDDDEAPVSTDDTPTAAEPSVTDEPSPEAGTMELSSSAFEPNATIPTVYTCDGDNISPPLTIVEVPDEAVALALIVDDPDAPSGSFIHWAVWSIDPATTEVAEGAVPAGASEGLRGAGGSGYTGPCPPTGVHRYIFTLYALDAELTLDAATAGRDELVAAMEGHIVAEAELIGTYSRTGPTTG